MKTHSYQLVGTGFDFQIWVEDPNLSTRLPAISSDLERVVLALDKHRVSYSLGSVYGTANCITGILAQDWPVHWA
jgi:hypothetical protein